MRHCLFVFAIVAVGCGGNTSTESTTGETTSAVSAAAGDATTASTTDADACLTTYVTCVRGGATTCKDDLHACIHPKSGDGGKGCDGDHHGGPPGGPGHGPHDGSGPPDGGGHPDGKRPDASARKACIDALDTCAAGSDAPDACASAAKTCLDALPRPPAGGHGGHP